MEVKFSVDIQSAMNAALSEFWNQNPHSGPTPNGQQQHQHQPPDRSKSTNFDHRTYNNNSNNDSFSNCNHGESSNNYGDSDMDKMDTYPSNYPEFWREPASVGPSYSGRPANIPPPGPSSDVICRSPSLEYGYNATFPMSSIELEPLSGVLSFTSSYKEFPVFKDKVGPDSHPIADALLSLKHAVVHPSQMNGPLSPLSPTLTSLNHSGSSNMPSSSSFSYHNPTGHNGLSQNPGVPGGASGAQCMQGTHYPGDSPPQSSGMGGQYHPQFPSMSVNVSMSMNVGMSANMGPMQNHDQWGASYPTHPQPSGPAQYTPPHGMTPQPPYPAYSPGSASTPAAYHSSYTLGDLRSTNITPKDVFYRNNAESYKSSIPRFYSLSPLSMRRAKMSQGRGGSSAADAAKVNLCRICGKTYARPSTLKTHMRTHSGEKPYRCPTCNKSFSQAANLTAHVRTHSGEKPFRCPVCERRFSQSSSVTTHMRTHSGERPYRCRMCKKAFSDSSTLTKHLRIHSGEKPYQCKLCLLRFSQSGNLNRHMRVHANNG